MPVHRIHRFYDRYELTDNFSKWLAEYLSGRSHTHIALSGGSTPLPVYESMGDEYRKEIDWSTVSFYWGDERCVPPTHAESNYKMAYEAWLKPAGVPEKNIHRIYGEAPDPRMEARRYGDLLMRSLPVEDGFPIFDLILLGMGDDGHTASIFPHQSELLNAEQPCAVATHPTSGQERVTLTGPVLQRPKKLVFLVAGANKREPATAILEGYGQASNYPAAHVAASDGSVDWWIDEEVF